MKLSVVLATRNEEKNIERCLLSVQNIADEIIVFDEHSTDNTVSIAKRLGARVFETKHENVFHVTKQKAIDAAQGEWILQLDADEVVSPLLSSEIKKVITMSNQEIRQRVAPNPDDARLFKRHAELLNIKMEGNSANGEVVAFLIPRVNMFLGHPLIHGGVYPDGVIRLIKKGKAHLPAKSVHEQMHVDGLVSWLFNPLEHWDSPTLARYISRLNRYTDLQAQNLTEQKVNHGTITFLKFTIILPLRTFLDRFLLHRGYQDGLYGFVWALFSSWHFPISYFKFETEKNI